MGERGREGERDGGREVNGTNTRKCMHAIMCNLC